MINRLKPLMIGIGVALSAAVYAGGANAPSIIPQPQKMELRAGEFHLAPHTKLFANLASLRTAKQLAARLHPATGYPLRVKIKWFSSEAIPDGVLLTTRNADVHLGSEGYELTVTTNSVVIRAPTQAGLFYGVQTLLQLLPPEIFSTNLVMKDWTIPCVRIEDWPRFKWRGLMLDVSRHFYSKEQVEKLLDLMAMYKLNTFHWHLTDDDGWRIEIKKYPRLTQVGAWRKSIGFGLDPKSSTAYSPDGRYGGYYTQKDIREVVAYAARRHITIVPEIEMPGHSGAALTAYPELSCSGRPYTIDRSGVFHTGVYCPANPETFTFLENVLNEVFRLFPGQYIHIGGDEVPMGVWANNPACQALMKRDGLRSQEELQGWFTQRIANFIVDHGKTPIGWSEVLQSGLAPNIVVMDWKGGGKEAAIEGHAVVMSPTAYCYFDYYQSTNHTAEPRAIGGFLPLKKVYSFEPIPVNLPPQFQSQILGAQANLWTEYIASLPQAEYMLFPRLCALAEVLWSPNDAHDWADFQHRLRMDERCLDSLGVVFRPTGEMHQSQCTNNSAPQCAHFPYNTGIGRCSSRE